jgi:predicted permease
MLLVAGVVAAAVTVYTVWRNARLQDKNPSSLLVASSGPAVIFLPSALLMGGVVGGAGILFVCLMTLLASFVFWLLVRRRLSSKGSRPGGEVGSGAS